MEPTGILVAVTSTETDGDRLLLAAARQGGGWLVLLGVVSLAGAAAQLLLPAAVGHAIDAILARNATAANLVAGNPVGPLVSCAILVAVIVGCGALTGLATAVSGATATARLRRLLAGHVVAVGPRLLTSATMSTSPSGTGFSAGDTVSRVVAGAADAGTAPASVLLAATAAIPPAGSIVALGLIDPWLAAAFAAGFPAFAAILRTLVRDSSDVSAGYGRAQGAIAARLLDALAGARTIAAAGTRARERERVLAPLPLLREHGYAIWRVQARAAAQAMTVAPVLQVIVIAVAGVELARHRITAGDLVAASQYAVLAVGIGASVGLVSQLGRARGGARRAAELLARPCPRYGARDLPAGRDQDAAGHGRGGRGELRLSGITVRHDGQAVLRDLDLTVPPGAAVAIVGRSGAGKSTLARLAGRLADPDAGTVLLDGTDLRELTKASLRESVVYAFERPELVGDTPFDVIRFGFRRPDDAQVRAAAGQAQAAAFLARLPRQLSTSLDGTPLSGGEVQRLGLARAFAHAGAARLLVLDDATSSLDTVTEMLVARAITSELSGLTRLVVAHRATTAARADLVAWLDGGRIRALAPHGELWADREYRAIFGSPDGPADGSADRGGEACLSVISVATGRTSRGSPRGPSSSRSLRSPPAGRLRRRPPSSWPAAPLWASPGSASSPRPRWPGRSAPGRCT
jgi:ATP-binding cassette subfamily B protein